MYVSFSELSERTVWEQVRDITHPQQAKTFGTKLGLEPKAISEILFQEQPNISAHVMFVKMYKNTQDNEILTKLNSALEEVNQNKSLDLASSSMQPEPLLSEGTAHNCIAMSPHVLTK